MIKTLLTTTAVVALLATGSLAQDQTAAPATTTEAPAQSLLASGYLPTDTDNLASEIMGKPVYSSTATDAEQIGDINNLVIGPDGRIAAVIIGVGGFLGIGEKNVAVDYTELQWTQAADNTDRFVLATSKEALEAAPEFVARDDAMNNNAMNNDAMNNDAAAGTAVPADASQPAMTAPADSMTPAPADGTTVAPANGAMVDRSTLTDVTITTEQLKGTTAYGPSGEDLGRIGDVVLAEDGKAVEAVIIDFGGFLGIGTKPVAVGFDTLAFQADANNNRYVYLNVTREQLDAAPAFDATTYKTDPAGQRLVVGN